MSPEGFQAFLKIARAEGVAAFEVGYAGTTLKVSLAPGGGTVARRPKPGEVEDRLGDVDEDVLYGSSGGSL